MRATVSARLHGFVILAISLSSLVFGAEQLDPRFHPRSLGEIKAMLSVLEPKKSGSSLQDEYLSRLKQYRYLCYVPYENLQWDNSEAELAEHAAMICSKLGHLTHNPEKPAGMSDADYELGKKGAGQSNLFMGVTKPSACVDGWMNDSDQSNIDRVGHRRWCINPTMGKSAFGRSGNFAAMYAFDSSNKKIPDWDFVSFPARGFMPIQFFGNKYAWSVSPNMAHYAAPVEAQIKVSIRAADAKFMPTGEPLKLDYFHVDTGGFGSGPAIIFRPDSFSLSADASYVVEISGVKPKKSGLPPTITYLVHFVDIKKAPDGPEAAQVYTKFYRERLTAIAALTDKVDQLEQLTAISEDENLKLAEASVNTTVQKAIQDMLKDPALRKEQEAAQSYKTIYAAEQKAGKSKQQKTQAAMGYRDLAAAYKDTRAGKRAAEDFERLKKELEEVTAAKKG